MTIGITRPDGQTYDIIPSDSSYAEASIMSDDTLHIEFEAYGYMDIPAGSYTSFDGKTYYLDTPADCEMTHTRLYSYTLDMHTAAFHLKHIPYINATPGDGRVSFPVTGNAATHLAMLVAGANMADTRTWVAGTAPTDTQKTITYDSITLWSALELIAETFETEFSFSEAASVTINIGKMEYNKAAPVQMAYGKGNGLLPGIKKRSADSEPASVAAIVKGGNRNINTSSNQSAYGAKTLHMPDGFDVQIDGDTVKIPFVIGYNGSTYRYSNGYVDGDSSPYRYYGTGFNMQYFIIKDGGRTLYHTGTDPQPDKDATRRVARGMMMGISDLSDIYPHLTHTVSSVATKTVTRRGSEETETQYSIFISFDINIDYSSLKIPGQTISVIFQTGNLAGREFECSYIHNLRKFTLKSREIDDTWMPSGVFVPAQGDTFIVTGCMVPYQYIRNDADHSGAEWDMARKAVKELYERLDYDYSTEAGLDRIAVMGLTDENYGKIILGGYMTLTAQGVFADGITKRITRIRRSVHNSYDIEVSLSEKSEGRRRRRLLADRSQSVTVEAGTSDALKSLNSRSSASEYEEDRNAAAIQTNTTAIQTNTLAIQANTTAIGSKVDSATVTGMIGTSLTGLVSSYESSSYAEGWSEEEAVTPESYTAYGTNTHSFRAVTINDEYESEITIEIHSEHSGMENRIMIRNEQGQDITLFFVTQGGEPIVTDTPESIVVEQDTTAIVTFVRAGDRYTLTHIGGLQNEN